MAVKESYLGPHWWEDETWYTETEEDGTPYRLPREAFIHALMSYRKMLPHSRNVVEYDSYAVYEDRHMYRLYMQFCQHGDLNDMISMHARLRDDLARDPDGNLLQ